MKRWLQSVLYALNGIVLAFKSQPNLRIQGVLALLVLSVAAALGCSVLEWLLLLNCIAMVMAGELINSSIEALCNHLHPQKHERIGQVKDMAAGAILILSLGAALVGILILGPKLLDFLKILKNDILS